MRRQLFDARLDPGRLIRAAPRWTCLPVPDPAAAISALKPQNHQLELRWAIGALLGPALRVCVSLMQSLQPRSG